PDQAVKLAELRDLAEVLVGPQGQQRLAVQGLAVLALERLDLPGQLGLGSARGLLAGEREQASLAPRIALRLQPVEVDLPGGAVARVLADRRLELGMAQHDHSPTLV